MLTYTASGSVEEEILQTLVTVDPRGARSADAGPVHRITQHRVRVDKSTGTSYENKRTTY